MLNHDEEEVLKVLLKLCKEQNTRDISGSFKDFPAAYQICYKEIISRLNNKNFVLNFNDFIAGDFILTITQSAIKYFSEKEKIKKDETIQNSNSSLNLNNCSLNNYEDKKEYKSPDYCDMIIMLKLKSFEKYAETLEDNLKNNLEDLCEEIKNLYENSKISSTVTANKQLVEKIYFNSKQFPWIYNEIINILGNIFIKKLLK